MEASLNTFKTIFESQTNDSQSEIKSIIIPRIQRDYAQGRKNEEILKIRNRFLSTLKDALLNSEKITLDFVYGDIDDKGNMTPLDGQQRLTTLFLLHWYISQKESIDASEYVFLEQFSYETRPSAQNFCKELIRFKPSFSCLVSEEIQNQFWYPLEWKNDPTIQSMFVMIDTIQGMFKDMNNVWNKLINEQIISFYFLPIEKMGLTDEIYIKMNSRGKPLTQFEHFKAEFEAHLKAVNKDIAERIGRKIDQQWTNMLWPYRGDNHIIDDEFIKFYRFICDVICYTNSIPLINDDFESAKTLFGKSNEDAQKNIMLFEQYFDCWVGEDIHELFDTYLSSKQYVSGKVKIFDDNINLFKDCCEYYSEYSGRSRKFPLSRTLLLYAFILYLINKDRVTSDEFRDRIRTIRNLIFNSTDEIREDRMNSLLLDTEHIVLKGVIDDFSTGYNAIQRGEEREKQSWRFVNSDNSDSLSHLEDHNLLRGSIAIVGLDNQRNFDKFRNLFNDCDRTLINRALLSIDDFSQQVSWRRQFGANNDSVWNSLFHKTKNRGDFDNTQSVINSLLDQLSEISNDSLQNIIDEYLSQTRSHYDWRYYFVKYDVRSNFGTFYWRNKALRPYEIYQMNTELSLGGKNWDVFALILKKHFETKCTITLNEYAYSEGGSVLTFSEYQIQFFNEKIEIKNILNGEIQIYSVYQENGIDKEDRVEKYIEIIKKVLSID